MQLVDAIPETRKIVIKENRTVTKTFCFESPSEKT